MQRLKSKGISFFIPQFKSKAHNSWLAVQDSFFSTKETFERHRVVFTVGTSIASVATAWVGYSIRHYHESQINQRLESIERTMQSNYQLAHGELKQLVDPGSSRVAPYLATAGTAFIFGYGFGWRGGKWYANRAFKRAQMKSLGLVQPRRLSLSVLKQKGLTSLSHIKPKGLKLQFLRKRQAKSRVPEGAVKTSESTLKDVPTQQTPETIGYSS